MGVRTSARTRARTPVTEPPLAPMLGSCLAFTDMSMEDPPTGSAEGAASRRLPFRSQNSESSDAAKETSLKDKEGEMLEYCFVPKKTTKW